MFRCQLYRLFVLLVLFALEREVVAQNTTPTSTLSKPILQDHVDRFLGILNGYDLYNQTEYEDRFSPSFVDQAPLKTIFLPIVEELQLVADEWQVVQVLDESTANAAVLLFAPADTGEPLLVLSISIDPGTGKVNGFLISSGDPPELENPPQTMQEAVGQLKAMGHNFNYIVAGVDTPDTEGMPKCSALAGEGMETPAPLGSMFKFWVLAAVLNDIHSGTITWDQLVFVSELDKSLPTGIVQDDPPGSNRTVRELAELMISISDNTATDLLMKLVGRLAVEQGQVDYGHHNPSLNIPFVNTKEWFILKLDGVQGDGHPGPLGEQYIQGDEMERRAILDELANTTIDSYGLDLAVWAGGPIAVEELEWFASPMDLCNVLARLYQNEEASRILSTNPGVPDVEGIWSFIGYKGGSEPGVLGMAWYLVANSTDIGHRVVTGTLWDPDKVIDETQTVLLMAALRDLFFSEDFGQGEVPATTSESTSGPTSGSAEIPTSEPADSPYPEAEDTEPPGQDIPDEGASSSATSTWLPTMWLTTSMAVSIILC